MRIADENGIVTDKRKLMAWLALLLGAGFIVTSFASYSVSRDAIRQSIIANELPLTSKNVYLELQKDLMQPLLISSMMANHVSRNDWIAQSEKQSGQIGQFLREVRSSYGVATSFFIPAKSRVYYNAHGAARRLRPDAPGDAWYFRVRDMQTPYEINFDYDQDNHDLLTFFANYRVLDDKRNFIGVTGVGLTVETIKGLIDDYQKRYDRKVYFTNTHGSVILSGSDSGLAGKNIRELTGLEAGAVHAQVLRDGSFQYSRDDRLNFLSAWFIPELNWYLFVEKTDTEALLATRETFRANLIISLAVTALVLLLTHIVISRYQRRLEVMATTDSLTGLPNRRMFEMLIKIAISGAERRRESLAILLLDIDHFKSVNDRYGHLAGDSIIRDVGEISQRLLRDSDILCRWGGEEYAAILKGCDLDNARLLAEKFCTTIRRHDFRHGGEPITLTVSCGVAQYNANETPGQWFWRVDSALYAAKKTGRNRVCAAA
ncbi:MAG: sensor domain-containing diguanylate cyclase [Azonexus sp.]|nr:sensor domain-containing diguanylate cyclase [Azonexus sp.]